MFDLPQRHLQGTDLALMIEPLPVRQQVLHVLEAALSLPWEEDLQHRVDVHEQTVFVRESAS